MRKYIPILFFLFISQVSFAQHKDPIEMQLLKKGNKLPENLVSTRSAVIIDANDPKMWKEKSFTIHNQLKAMGLDVVMYFYYGDLHSSPKIKRIYEEMISERKIGNILWFSFHDNRIKFALAPYSDTELLVDPNSETWYTENKSLNDLLFEFALNVKKKEYEQSNFLIPDAPEFFEDVPLIEKTEYPSYPTQLKRLPLVVVEFPYLEYDTTMALNDQQKNALEAYNADIRRQNEKLRSFFADYPYKVEFIKNITDEEAFDKGHQFLLRYLYTFGNTIKNLLNYESESDEEDFVSVLPNESGKRTLKAISGQERVYKYYIKHSSSGDAYMGRYWDADHDWEIALNAFIHHLMDQMEK